MIKHSLLTVAMAFLLPGMSLAADPATTKQVEQSLNGNQVISGWIPGNNVVRTNIPVTNGRVAGVHANPPAKERTSKLPSEKAKQIARSDKRRNSSEL